MKKKQRKALCRYIRWIADEINLRDWVIDVEHEPCAEDRAGNVVCIEGQKRMRISFAGHFMELPPDEQRDTVVHELVHAHWEGCWRMVQGDLADALGKPVYYVFCDSYRRQMEYGVDALAKALAERLPHINWEAT